MRGVTSLPGVVPGTSNLPYRDVHLFYRSYQAIAEWIRRCDRMEGENTHKAEELGQGGLLVEKHTHPGLEDFGVDGSEYIEYSECVQAC